MKAIPPARHRFLLLFAFAAAFLFSFFIYRRSLPTPPSMQESLPPPTAGVNGEKEEESAFLPLHKGPAFDPPLSEPSEPSDLTDPTDSSDPSDPSDTSALPSGEGGEDEGSSPAQEENALTLSFVGDCMLATLYGGNGPDTLNYEMDRQDPSFFFQYVASYFEEDDFTFANCENVFTDAELSPVGKNYRPAYWYRSAAKNAGIFRAAGIDGVSVCNNHAGDYGEQGYADTRAALESAGVLVGESAAPLIVEKKGLRIGIVCANLYGEGQTDKILRQVRELKESCGYIIVYFHGGTERIHEPEDWKVTACRKIAEEGADLILGCHPHVLQRSEVIPRADGSTAYVVYSLGNFLFGGGRSEENRTAIVRLHLTLEEGAVLDHRLEFVPCYVYATKDHSSPECWIPRPMEEGDEKEKVLAFLRGDGDTPV